MNVSGFEEEIDFAPVESEVKQEDPQEECHAEEPVETEVEGFDAQMVKGEATDAPAKVVEFEKSICDHIKDNWMIIVAIICIILAYVYKLI